jgi:hypothetical protein
MLIDREHKWAVWVGMETLVGWICPSLSTHAKVGCRPPICHPDRSVAQWRDLLFALMEKRNLEAICQRHIRCARK